MGHSSNVTSSLAGHDGTAISRLHASALAYNSADPSDYLAGGYWLHASGDILGTFDIDEAGAFADGPETCPIVPQCRSWGRPATAAMPRGCTRRTPRARRSGSSRVTWRMTADSPAAIGGCVGCNGGVSLNGPVRLPRAPRRNAVREQACTVARPSPWSIQTSSSSNSWGGMFSSVPDAAMRLVADAGRGAATADGSKAVFVPCDEPVDYYLRRLAGRRR